MVTNTNDTGTGSLRQAVSDANSASGADVIEFDSSLEGATIGLTSGNIAVSDELTITGLGQELLTVSGQRISRAFYVSTGVTASITDMTIKWGQEDSGLGGQVYVDLDASLTLARVTLHDSQALWGGAIYNNFGSVTLNECTVSEGKAFRHGGGIDSNGLLTVIDTSFLSNYAAYDGGAIHGSGGYDGVADISGSTFWDNVAAEDGGAIANLATMVIKNSTITGNRASGVGGAINNWYTLSLTIYNSTIVNNTASSIGGIVNTGTTATLYSTILSQNSGGDSTPDTIGGSNNYIGGDPLLEPINDNGGLTLTHELPDNSPAAGGGSNPLDLQYDQRGNPYAREWDGVVDIGAFQRQPPPPLALVVDTVLDENDGDYSAGNLSLREAIELTNTNPGTDSISFDPSISGRTMNLVSGSMTISGGLTLDGSGASPLTIVAAPDSRIFLVDDGDPDASQAVSISNLLLTGGGGYNGGVIYNAETLSLVDISINESTTAGDGGAIYNAESGTLTLSGSTLDGNDAAQHGADGGAIYNLGLATIDRSTISNSQALGGDDNVGGGIYNGPSGNLTIIESQITNNFTIIAGGGIENLGTLTVQDSTIADNTCFSGSGGGIDNYGGSVSITGSTLSGNAASGSGGAIWTDTILVVRNSTLSNNRAEGFGGAIGMFDGEVTVENSTIAYNTADSQNQGSASGGGIDVGRREGAGVLTTISTIWAYNTVGSGAASDITTTDGTVSSASSNNLITSAGTAGGIRPDVNGNLVGSDPLLGNLSDNGGTTLTHALPTGSPAIDAGANPESLSTDQRGETREVGDGPDIGAYESQEDQSGGGGGDNPSLDVLIDSQVSGSAVVGDTHYIAYRNAYHDLILMIGSGSNWQAVRLSEGTGNTLATDSPIVWVEGGSIVWIGDPTVNGFRMWRYLDGAWTPTVFNEPGLAIRTSVTQFTTRPENGTGQMYVAGLTASGDLVAYHQTDGVDANGWIWETLNLSDDLRAQSMTTPAFEQLVSYVTPWNQWTIAGLDPAGDVQGVWIMPGRFQQWRVDNLSDITGAAPIAGQLTVTQTSWSAINIGGVDNQGHVVVSWWVPGKGGSWTKSDLTTISGGTPLEGGKVAGFITPWGAINYAGLAADGEVTAYWWTPTTQQWQQAELTNGGGDRPTGEMTSYVSEAGTISILGVASDAHAVRLAWTPNTDNRWNLLDLTDTAEW